MNALATASYWYLPTSPPPLTSSLIQSCLSCKGAASFVGNIRDLLCVSISACRCRRTDIQNESLAHEAVPSRTGAGLIPGFHQKFKVSLISVAPMFAGLRWAAFGYTGECWIPVPLAPPLLDSRISLPTGRWKWAGHFGSLPWALRTVGTGAASSDNGRRHCAWMLRGRHSRVAWERAVRSISSASKQIWED